MLEWHSTLRKAELHEVTQQATATLAAYERLSEAAQSVAAEAFCTDPVTRRSIRAAGFV